MKIAIHQPNFLPWGGYFAKIARVDTFVFLDDVQYEKQGYTNRVRLRNDRGAFWLIVPVSHKSGMQTALTDILIALDTKWRKKHLRTFDQMYGKSPYFPPLYQILVQEYENEHRHLADFNIGLVEAICQHLGWAARFVRSSELDTSNRSTERLINICQVLGADTYLSGRGGRKYQEETLFARNGISLEYIDYECKPYPQGSYPDFIPNLSIIDMIFNIGPEETAQRLVESGTT